MEERGEGEGRGGEGNPNSLFLSFLLFLSFNMLFISLKWKDYEKQSYARCRE